MLFKGTFVHCPTLGSLEIHADYLLAVSDDGYISHFEAFTTPASTALLANASEPAIKIPQGSFLLPTFVDLHLHAPQFLYQGTGLHLPLMQWLEEYAYKAEERIDKDPELARRVYQRLAERLVENGTGAVMLFGTIDEETNLILAEVMLQFGLRAYIGKLSMDIPPHPTSTYTEPTTDASLASLLSFIERLRALTSSLPPHLRIIQPVLTPRFIPTCSDDLLRALGRLAEYAELRVQSHAAEAKDEVEWVRKERGMDDLEVFDLNNLLTRQTTLAHCTHLTTPSLDRLSRRGTSIAHCPLSNAYFSSLPFPLREALSAGVKVGLGTDVAGGYSADIGDAMRAAVGVARMREGRRVEEGGKVGEGRLGVSWMESVFLATRGGANALGVESGAFRVGAPFDAQMIQAYTPSTPTPTGTGALDFFDSSLGITAEVVEKWWFVGDTRNRVGMWVQGRKLGGGRA